MKKILLIALLSICSLISAKNFVLKDLVYPKELVIKDNLLFINDHEERVKVYDLKTKKLLSEFGKSGEGPGEFLGSRFGKSISLRVVNSKILVESNERLSIFKFNGEYIKDIKLPMGFLNVMPINQNSYILEKMEVGKKGTYQLVIITDKKFKKQVEIAKKKFGINFLKPNEINAFSNLISFDTYGGKIFLVDTEEFEIKIIDGKTKKINKFKHPYKRRKVSSKDKKEFANRFKKKKKIIYPDYFPAIKNIMCDKDNLYVITNKKEGIKQEILVFNHKGKLKKELSLKLEQEDKKHIYPYTLYNSKLYQIVEKDEDTWELQITDF